MNAFIDTVMSLYASSTRKITQKDIDLINQEMAVTIDYHNQYLAEMSNLTGITMPAPIVTLTPNGTPSTVVPDTTMTPTETAPSITFTATP